MKTPKVIVVDTQRVNSSVARIVVAADKPDRASIRASINAFNPQLRAIPNSFHQADESGRYHVGFAHTIVSRTSSKKGFQLVAKNIYMNNADKSTWRAVTTDNGKVCLESNDVEDVDQLLSLAAGSRSPYVPRAKSFISSSLAEVENSDLRLTSFLNPKAPQEVDYGFRIGDKCSFYSVVSNAVVRTIPQLVIAFYDREDDAFSIRSRNAKGTEAYFSELSKSRPKLISQAIADIEADISA